MENPKTLRAAILAAAHHSVIVDTPEGCAAAGDLLEAAIRYYVTDVELLSPLEDVPPPTETEGEAMVREALEGEELDTLNLLEAVELQARTADNPERARLAYDLRKNIEADRPPGGFPVPKIDRTIAAQILEEARPGGSVTDVGVFASEEAGAEPEESDLERAAREHRETHGLERRSIETGKALPEPETRQCAHCGKHPASVCRDCYAGRFERRTAADRSHSAPSGYALLATRWCVPTSLPKEGYDSIDAVVSSWQAEGATFYVLERVESEGDGVYRCYVYSGLDSV